MARIHILEGSGLNLYRVVVHDAAPAGDNVVGVAWSDAIKNSGNNVSQMTVGNGPGQIATAENNNVTNGTVIEGSFVWQNNPTWTNAERQADMDLRATQLIQELQDTLQARLRLYGATRT